jgi:thiamine biosynthesis lipoprotein
LPLKEFWKADCPNCLDPDPADDKVKAKIYSLSNLVGFEKISISDSLLIFEDSLTKIDLGGIAKAMVISEIEKALKSYSINNFIISSGGDIRAFGKKTDDKPFKIGIKNPRSTGIIAVITISSGYSVVTSGDYERFRNSHSGIRVHHLIDKKTLYPATKNRSVTIIGHLPSEVDILSTALFSLSSKEIIDYVSNRKNLDAIVIDSTETVTYSDGIKELELLDNK